METKCFSFVGLDVSLNHLGMCAVSGATGKLTEWAFLADVKKFVKEDLEHGELYRAPSARSDHSDHFRRIETFVEFICAHLGVWLSPERNQIVSIEGYALKTKNTRMYETAELTGAIKREVVRRWCSLRVYDPDTVKSFAVNYGHAQKEQMYQQFVDETGVSIPTTWLKDGGKRILSGPGTDVADAYFLARMAWMEHQLRVAEIRLQDLPPHLQKIFTRETKAYPLNLMERPYAELMEDADA